jgi:5-methylcytosine-specific restriction endonuclease McrA
VVKKKSKLSTWLTPKLRRISYQWKARKDAKTAARISRGKYECNMCSEIHGPKEICLDHIVPVVDPNKGFTDWNDYIEKLFCNEDGFQVLCKPCHDVKTQEENGKRKVTRKKVKKKLTKKKKSGKIKK